MMRDRAHWPRKHPSNKIIELTDAELAECRRVANERAGWLSKNVYNKTRRDTSRSQVDTDYVGMVGEYGVAKLFGFGFDACGLMQKGLGRPDDISTSAAQIDGGRDMVLPNGLTAQIKSVEVHSNPNYSYWYSLDHEDPTDRTVANEFTADVGILALVLRFAPGRVKIPGYITRDRFLNEYWIGNLGSGPRAQVAGYWLDPIEQLMPSTATVRTAASAVSV